MAFISSSKVFLLILVVNQLWQICESKSENSNGNHRNINQNPCPEGDKICLSDKLGFDAIKQLHSSIDDDSDGNLDRSESDGFIRDELHYEDGFDRHTNFHGSDDHISVKDLWQIWIKSEVYNWTTEEVIEWLESQVELPQYTESFKSNNVVGKMLPRLAAGGQFIATFLGVKNAIDKQKLAVKAQDAVLFGAPKKPHSYVKDLLLVLSLVIAVGGCWLAYMQNKYSQIHLKKVMKDLDQLQSAEDALSQLKSQLDDAHRAKDNYAEEKKSLEIKMKDEIQASKEEAEELRVIREATAEEIGRLKLAEQELEKYKRALDKAEIELQQQSHQHLGELQQWLQLTYEMESIHYNAKREAAEKQLIQAKEMCEKIRRKRGAFLGSLRVAHTTSVDDTDHSISCARSALEEVKQDLQERSTRWRQIEKICGYSIAHNPGLEFLESVLRAPTGSISSNNLRDLVQPPHSVDDADEDMPPGPFTAQAAFYGNKVSSSQNSMRQGNIHSSNHCLSSISHAYSLSGSLPQLNHNLPTYLSCRDCQQQSGVRFSKKHMLGMRRSSTDHGVWPHLMRAGMQLTMLGLNLTDQRLRGVQPFSTIPELHDRSSTWSTADAYNNRPTQSRPTAFKPANSVSNSTASIAERGKPQRDDTDSVSTISGTSTGNGKITFDLGENSPSETPDDDTIKKSPLLGQSRSMDVKCSTVRPRILTTAQSESALSGLASLKKTNGANGSTQQKLLTKHHITTESMNELSSLNESMDSLNDSEDNNSTGGTSVKGSSHKKKNKFLSKLFKGKAKES